MEVLHASPHPDDELIGAPATLMALRDAGHRIVNFAGSLGRPEHAERRRRELEEACERAGFELVVAERPLTAGEARGTAAVRAAAEQRIRDELASLLATRPVGLVVAPSPHDRHPAHELVGRAARAALELRAEPAHLWLWALWGEIALPTTVVSFDDDRLHEILFALGAHVGELARNDYAQLVTSRGRAQCILAAERVFGFGSAGLPGPFVETTSEVVWDDGRWLLGAARELDVRDPLPAPAGPEVGWWLHASSVTDRLAASRTRA